jgi:hypothetical protein
MLDIALELSHHDPSYDDVAEKFLEHFLWIAGAMDRVGLHDDGMWDEDDGFFYDVLRLPDGSARRLKVRSTVGLLPLCASTVFAPDTFDRLPRFQDRSARFIRRHPDLIATIAMPDRSVARGRYLLSLLNERKLRRVLAIMLNESEFLSPYGIRSLSRRHLEHPFALDVHGQEHRGGYLPAESDNGMYDGNSNWRGPIWMPVNFMLLRGLMNLHTYYGDDFKGECPTGSPMAEARRHMSPQHDPAAALACYGFTRSGWARIAAGASSTASTASGKTTTARSASGQRCSVDERPGYFSVAR